MKNYEQENGVATCDVTDYGWHINQTQMLNFN
jgi:hypothetical protein